MADDIVGLAFPSALSGTFDVGKDIGRHPHGKPATVLFLFGGLPLATLSLSPETEASVKLFCAYNPLNVRTKLPMV
jgi:hypothetical protein